MGVGKDVRQSSASAYTLHAMVVKVRLPHKRHPFRDEAYSREDWDAHVTWRRYLPDGLALPIVLASLSPLILWTVLVSMGVGLYATFAEPKGAPMISDHPTLITPFNLTSFALSLLMLYKTNSAYARWWEARTQLGTLYINVRSIVRLSVAWVGPKEPHLAQGIYQWTTAIMPALCAYLRENTHYYRHLDTILSPDQVDWLACRGIPPVAALQVISDLLSQASLSDMQRSTIEQVINSCDTVVGACERIQRQPMPIAYNRHTHRFLLTYITFLPFALWPLYEWATLPIMAVTAFLLLGVENIGIQIEEPFRVLPLDQMCAAARRATTFMQNDRLTVHSMGLATAKACREQQEEEGEPPGKEQAEQAQRSAASLAGNTITARGGAARAMPNQFSQMSVLPANLGDDYAVPVTELLGLAAGLPPRRSSIDQRPGSSRSRGASPGSPSRGGPGQGGQLRRRYSQELPSRLGSLREQEPSGPFEKVGGSREQEARGAAYAGGWREQERRGPVYTAFVDTAPGPRMGRWERQQQQEQDGEDVGSRADGEGRGRDVEVGLGDGDLGDAPGRTLSGSALRRLDEGSFAAQAAHGRQAGNGVGQGRAPYAGWEPVAYPTPPR